MPLLEEAGGGEGRQPGGGTDLCFRNQRKFAPTGRRGGQRQEEAGRGYLQHPGKGKGRGENDGQDLVRRRTAGDPVRGNGSAGEQLVQQEGEYPGDFQPDNRRNRQD